MPSAPRKKRPLPGSSEPVKVASRAPQRGNKKRDLLRAQRASELRLQNIIGSITDAFIALDRQWRILYLNPNFMRLVEQFCSSPEDLLGEHAWEMFKDLAKGDIAGLSERAMAEQEPGVAEVFYQPLGLWLEVHVCPSPEMLSVHVRDITERRRYQQYLRKQTQRTQLLSDMLAQLLGAADPDTVVRDLFSKVASHLDVDVYFNFMVNEMGDALRLHSCAGIPADVAKSIERLEFGQAICGTVAQTRQPMVVNDIQHSDYDKAALVRSLGIQTYACHPLLAGSRLIGTLSFASTTRPLLEDDELEFIRIISQHTAVALDRLQSARALRESEHRYRHLLQSLPAAVYTTDQAGCITLYNEAAAELWGRKPELGQESWCGSLRIYRPDGTELPLSECPMAVTLKEGRAMHGEEIVIERPDGERRNVLTHPAPLLDASGTMVGALNMLLDITERKRSEALLEGQKHVLELIAEDAPLDSVLDALVKTVELGSSNTFVGAILLLDEDGCRLRLGAAPSLNAEYKATLDGLLVEPAHSPYAAAAAKKPVSVTDIATDSRWPNFKELALAHDLRACWSTPIFSRDGSVLGTFTMHYSQPREMNEEDWWMTAIATRTASIAIERERWQTALRESEVRYRTLMEHASDAIFVCDRHGRFVMANPAGCRMVGYTLDELRQLRVHDTYLPEELAMADQRLKELNEGKALHIERRMRRKDGSYFDADADVTKLPSGLIYASLRDATERKRGEAQLLQAKENAEAANRAKDQFLAVLSHELRTPLTPVLMAVAALERDPDLRLDVRKDISMIRRNVELEARLIDDLLDVSRVASGKLSLRLEAVPLNDVVQQVCGICSPKIIEKGIRLHCDLGETVGHVNADPARLQQVLWNVLKNAAKFTPEDGDIYVHTTRTDEGRLQVIISDTGIGIEPDALPRIFNAFEQVRAGITREFGGLGLGLAISKALVDLHHGSIHVESEGRGKGCTFTIELPAGVAKREPPRSKPEEDNEKPSGLRLLVVEDHDDTARTLGRLLRASGHSVKIANDAATALKVAAEEVFDVLVSDIGLPDATGYELMQKLRERGAIKGIAMSGYGMDEDVSRSREAGFNEHLVKPVDVTELLDAIGRLNGNGNGK